MWHQVNENIKMVQQYGELIKKESKMNWFQTWKNVVCKKATWKNKT